MLNYFEDDNNSFQFKDESGYDENNEAAMLVSLHEGDILNEDGSLYVDSSETDVEEEDPDSIV
jgi:hypothetical protein